MHAPSRIPFAVSPYHLDSLCYRRYAVWELYSSLTRLLNRSLLGGGCGMQRRHYTQYIKSGAINSSAWLPLDCSLVENQSTFQ